MPVNLAAFKEKAAMAMQRTPLLMSNILDRGAKVAPEEEIVTATERGVAAGEARNRSGMPE